MVKRNINIRLEPEAFDIVNLLVEDSGLSKQKFFEFLIEGIQIPTAEDTDALFKIEKQLSDLNTTLRNSASNLNQIARTLNSGDRAEIGDAIVDLEIDVNETRQEVTNIWRSLKPLIAKRTQRRH